MLLLCVVITYRYNDLLLCSSDYRYTYILLYIFNYINIKGMVLLCSSYIYIYIYVVTNE